jgi:hypothetical protein
MGSRRELTYKRKEDTKTKTNTVKAYMERFEKYPPLQKTHPV